MAAKRKAKKTAKKKAPARKAVKTAKAKAPARKTARKAAKKTAAKTKRKTPAKAAARKPAVKKAKAPPRKKQPIVGEGDYEASRAFYKDEAAFVQKNRDRIPALGKQAEAALDGPEGEDLRDAEAAAQARSRDTF